MIPAVFFLVLFAAAVMIGVSFGKSIERVRGEHARDQMLRVHAHRLHDMENQIEAVRAVSQVVIHQRDEEIAALKTDLEAERRARVRDTAQPAGWGEEAAQAPEQTA